ncbi:unnamed protein product [Fraxinus pennsylvanica]|uniref:Pentatricopeptide repeat-containing protein n=1 Tax=Fraxinus pennsylvanica TaxID=56036 RepID=A0AAD1YR99_9LAMI|nr:unnamed protein product [Fraxinus pennsylvanica]
MLEVNSQLKEILKFGNLNQARKLFDEIPHKNEISWTTMISGYVNASDSSEALSLFSKMWVDQCLKMDPFILSLVLKACGLNMNVKYGEMLHGFSVKTGFLNSVFVGSAILDMYMKNGRVWEGCGMFDEMPLRNVVSWTAIITGLVRAGFNKEGLIYFAEMWRDGVEYDSYTLAIALKACADMRYLKYGKEIHARAMKNGVDVTSYVANSLATMYNKCERLQCGLFLFKSMNKRDVVSWTTIITSYIQMGQEKQGIDAFLQMRDSNVSPNEYTYAAVISGVANISRLDWGQQLHAHVLHIGGFAEKVFELLSWMRRGGPNPTEFALSSGLSVCGSMAILDQDASGLSIHLPFLLIRIKITLATLAPGAGRVVQETLTEILSKATLTAVEWVQMPRMKPGLDSIEIITISHCCTGIASRVRPCGSRTYKKFDALFWCGFWLPLMAILSLHHDAACRIIPKLKKERDEVVALLAQAERQIPMSVAAPNAVNNAALSNGKRAAEDDEMGPDEKNICPGISINIISELSDYNVALFHLRKKQQVIPLVM